MSGDLVTRLRENPERTPTELEAEAADEIERLTIGYVAREMAEERARMATRRADDEEKARKEISAAAEAEAAKLRKALKKALPVVITHAGMMPTEMAKASCDRVAEQIRQTLAETKERSDG